MTSTKGLFGAVAIVVVVALICISNIFFRYPKPADNRQPVCPNAKTIQYSFFLQNTTACLIKHAQLWTYAPVKQTSSQLCSKITASHPYDLLTDIYGNQVLKFSFDTLPPFAFKIIMIKATVLVSNQAHSMLEGDTKIYLNAEKYSETRDNH